MENINENLSSISTQFDEENIDFICTMKKKFPNETEDELKTRVEKEISEMSPVARRALEYAVGIWDKCDDNAKISPYKLSDIIKIIYAVYIEAVKNEKEIAEQETQPQIEEKPKAVKKKTTAKKATEKKTETKKKSPVKKSVTEKKETKVKTVKK